jgi:hypothetical protein
MRDFRRCRALLGLAALAAMGGPACGGSKFSTAPGGGDDGGVETGGGMSSSGGATEAGGPSDAGVGDGAAKEPGDAMTDATVPGDASAGACPDVRGSYTITVDPSGSGCGDLDTSAPECIRQSNGCDLEFRSNVSGGGPAGVAGAVTLRADGTFIGASLTEGSAARSGCVGAWNPVTATLGIDCGGKGTSQSCVVSLTRVGAVGLVCN